MAALSANHISKVMKKPFNALHLLYMSFPRQLPIIVSWFHIPFIFHNVTFIFLICNTQGESVRYYTDVRENIIWILYVIHMHAFFTQYVSTLKGIYKIPHTAVVTASIGCCQWNNSPLTMRYIEFGQFSFRRGNHISWYMTFVVMREIWRLHLHHLAAMRAFWWA